MRRGTHQHNNTAALPTHASDPQRFIQSYTYQSLCDFTRELLLGAAAVRTPLLCAQMASQPCISRSTPLHIASGARADSAKKKENNFARQTLAA
jgi:hypothetical protein